MTWVHDLDPFAIQIYGDFGIRWYGLAYLMGFVASYFIIQFLAKRGKVQLQSEQIWDFITYAAIGTMLGGRLGYTLFYSPGLLFDFSSQAPFWGVLRVNEGGMASHGGMLGVVVACILFARKYKLSIKHLCDLTVLGASIGIFFGRIANFINGELVGRAAPEGYAFAVKFPQDILSWSYGKMSILSDVVSKVGVSSAQWQEWLLGRSSDGSAQGHIYETLNKIIAGIQNGNVALKEALAPHLVARYPSQLIAGALEGGLIFIGLFFLWRKPRKPGVIGAWFVVIYALVRIFNEQFRMPDAHLGFQALGLTRGQWLSVVMLLVGFLLMYFFNRSQDSPLGGWSGQSRDKV